MGFMLHSHTYILDPECLIISMILSVTARSMFIISLYQFGLSSISKERQKRSPNLDAKLINGCTSETGQGDNKHAS